MGVTTTPATGARGSVHIAEETRFGVLVNPTHLIEFTSESLSAQESELMSEAIRDHRGMNQLVRGNLDIQGDISFEQNASGLGMILRHALGDYIKVPNADGGSHGRVMKGEQITILEAAAVAAAAEPFALVAGATWQVADPDKRLTTAITDVLLDGVAQILGTDYNVDLAQGRIIFVVVPAPTAVVVADIEHAVRSRYAIAFTPDHTCRFPASGKFARVFRNAARALELDDNAGNGYEYENYLEPVVTYAAASAAGVVTLAKVIGAYGSPVAPNVSPAGVIMSGSGRVLGTYHDTAIVGDDATITLSLGTTVAANDYIMILPVLLNTAPFAVTPGKGEWLYAFDEVDFAGAFTHHMERGRYLPTGLTIEVHRDAAVFLYTGCKVNSLALTFDANSIVTGTASLIGKIEHSIATLLDDVLPGATSIFIDKPEAFKLSGGMLTIGEETKILHGAITEVAEGRWEVEILNTTGESSIERFHPRGQNVDSRTSLKNDEIVSGLTTPLTSFETLVYIDGYWEEVLSASLTLNNNLSTDKFGLGSRFRLATVEGRAEIDGTLSMEFDDGKHYNKFLTGEKFSIEFKCISESDDSLIPGTGSSSGNPVPSQAYYFLPKCKYNGTTPQIGGPDIINHDMPFRAIVDNEYGDTDFVIILVNGLERDVTLL